MNPRVKSVKPNPDYSLTLIFTSSLRSPDYIGTEDEDDEVRIFDMKPYLHIGIFKELKNMSLFNSVKPFLGSIQWKNGQDLCPDTLYLESKKA